MGLCGIQKDMKNERGEEMTNIDISPEAVEHLCAIHEGYEQHGTVATLRALSAALDQSQDLVDRWINTSSEQDQTNYELREALTKSQAALAAVKGDKQ